MAENTNTDEDEILEAPKAEDFMLTLTVKRPLLHDLRSPEGSIRIENRFEGDSPDSFEEISYDSPALDVGVDFQAHESIAGVLKFATPADNASEESSSGSSESSGGTDIFGNQVVLMAADKEPGLLAAEYRVLVKCRPESGGNAVVVFDGVSPVPQAFAAPGVAAIFGVRDGEFHWSEIAAAPAEA